MRLYVVRHGETLFNQKHLIQGACDSPLTETGILEAKALGVGLKSVDFKGCYSSPLYRARRTAELIMGHHNTPIHTEKRLVEFNFGHYEGEPETKLRDIYPVLFGESIPGFDGDSTETVVKRVDKAFQKISTKYPEGNVLVVTHAGVISTWLREHGALPKEPSKDSGIKNCSVTILEKMDTGWNIVTANNTDFLDAGKTRTENK